MTKRTKKLLSLLLATTMVFSLNTTVFAEEVAVDSVEDAVEASEVQQLFGRSIVVIALPLCCRRC